MTAKEIPLEELEKIIFEEHDSWFPNREQDFWYRNERYEYMIAILVENDRKEDVIIYTNKILAEYEKQLQKAISEYGKSSEDALWWMFQTAYVYYDEIATSDCQGKDFYERGLEYAYKFLSVSEKVGDDNSILKAMDLVATGLKKLGRDEEATEMRAKFLEYQKKFVDKTVAEYGENSRESFSAMQDLADDYECDKNYSESLAIWQKMYEIFVKSGNDGRISEEDYNWRCEVVIYSMAEIYNKLERYEEEAKMLEKYVKLPEKYEYRNLEDLAEAYYNSKQYQKAVKVWLEMLLRSVEHYKLSDFHILRIISRLVYIYGHLEISQIEKLQKSKELKNLREEILNLYEDKYQSMYEAREDGDYIEDDIYYKVMNALANVYYLNGQYDKELEIRQEVWNEFDVKSYDDYIEIMKNIADNFKRAGMSDDESQARGFIEEYMANVTKKHYWDWDY